jgi:predicted RNA-binding protein with PIN domain
LNRRKEYLLVDGYNVIFTWDNLRKLAESSLEDARVKLLDILCDYQGFTQSIVIAVFDAHHTKGGSGDLEKHLNIHVVYTREAETADNFIERTAAVLSKHDRVRVVTSDYLEQIIVIGHGAFRVSANDFLKEVETLKSQMQPQYAKNSANSRNPLIDRVDRRTAELLERMRRNIE